MKWLLMALGMLLAGCVQQSEWKEPRLRVVCKVNGVETFRSKEVGYWFSRSNGTWEMWHGRGEAYRQALNESCETEKAD